MRLGNVSARFAGNQPADEAFQVVGFFGVGVGAENKIRDVLGSTDPSKAPPGSIRREFGSTIMVDAAHASDSPEITQREFGIVKPGENNFKQVIEEAYGKV